MAKSYVPEIRGTRITTLNFREMNFSCTLGNDMIKNNNVILRITFMHLYVTLRNMCACEKCSQLSSNQILSLKLNNFTSFVILSYKGTLKDVVFLIVMYTCQYILTSFVLSFHYCSPSSFTLMLHATKTKSFLQTKVARQLPLNTANKKPTSAVVNSAETSLLPFYTCTVKDRD